MHAMVGLVQGQQILYFEEQEGGGCQRMCCKQNRHLQLNMYLSRELLRLVLTSHGVVTNSPENNVRFDWNCTYVYFKMGERLESRLLT